MKRMSDTYLTLDQAKLWLLYGLYTLTAVRVISFANWCDAGAPNPFLPKRLKQRVRHFELCYRLNHAA